MIVAPPVPYVPTIAQIRFGTNWVTTQLPERNERFRLLMHALEYHWTGQEWRRDMDQYTGAALDRAAELGRKLIQSGFIVDFSSEQARDLAIQGSFLPECRRWVSKRTAGDYSNWFVVWWRRGEELYEEAMRISGARYNPPGVVVPAERYDEVIDFAQVNGCQLSAGAKSLVEEAKVRMAAALVCNLVDTPTAPKTKATETPAEPDKYEVIDELLDEPL